MTSPSLSKLADSSGPTKATIRIPCHHGVTAHENDGVRMGYCPFCLAEQARYNAEMEWFRKMGGTLASRGVDPGPIAPELPRSCGKCPQPVVIPCQHPTPAHPDGDLVSMQDVVMAAFAILVHGGPAGTTSTPKRDAILRDLASLQVPLRAAVARRMWECVAARRGEGIETAQESMLALSALTATLPGDADRLEPMRAQAKAYLQSTDPRVVAILNQLLKISGVEE